MDADTVSQLLADGFQLYGFKAVWSTDEGGRPLVWFSSRDYSINTFVVWWSSLAAYTSRDAIENGKLIRQGASKGIELGQIWKVEATGTGTVLIDGVKMAVSVWNPSPDEFTCGLAQSSLDSSSPAAPCCAFPLYPGFVDVIVPLKKILLIFSTNRVLPGTAVAGPFIDLPCNDCPPARHPVVNSATSAGILIDMAGQTDLTINLGILDGWNWGIGINARRVPPTENLIPLLIKVD